MPSSEGIKPAANTPEPTVSPVQSTESGDYGPNTTTAHISDLEWYRALSRHIPAMCFVLEPDGTIQSVSQVGLDMLGYRLEEMMGRSLHQFVALPDQPAFQAAYAALLQDPQMQPANPPLWNGWLERRDRPPLSVTISAQVVQTNERTGVVLVGHAALPVEPLTKPTAEPTASQRDRWVDPIQSDREIQLQLLTDALPVLISYADADQRYRFVNKAYETFFGCRREQLCGKFVGDVIGSEAYQVAKPYIERALAGYSVTYEIEMPYQTGGSRYIAASLVPNLDLQGQVQGYYALIRDITEQKRLERISQQSQARLQAVLDSAIADITSFRVFADKTWEYEYRSVGCEAVFGFTAAEMLAEPSLWRSRILPDDVEAVIQPRFQDFFAEQTSAVEYRFRHKDGSLRWISNVTSSRRDEAQDCWLVTAVATDITARKHAELALGESEARFRQLAENINVVFWITTVNFFGELLYISPAYETVWGRPCASAYQSPIAHLEAVHPDDLARLEAAIAQLRQAGQYDLEYRIFHTNGSLRWIRSRGFAVKDELGQIYRYAGIAEDVTQRKQAQEQLEASQILLSTAQQVAQIGSWEFNIAAQKIVWSEQNFRIYGLNPALPEPSYSELLQKFVPADRERLAIAVERAITIGVPYELDLLLLPLPEGLGRHLNARGEPVRDAQGRVVRLVGTTQDITERKHLEAQLHLQAQRQAVLHQVIQAIRNSLDLPTIFETAVRETGRLLGVSRVTLVQYLPECASWVVQAEFCQTPDISSRLGQEIPDQDNPLAEILKRGEVVRLDDNRTAAGGFNQQQAQLFPGRWLLVPLRIGSLTWGSLSLSQMQTSASEWQDWEVELATTLTDQLAIAIQQSELYQQVTLLNTQLESTVHLRTRQLQRALDLEASLKHITDQVRDSLDENQILQTAVEQLGTALGVECCDAGLYNFSTKTVTVCHEYVRTERQPSAKGTVLPLFALPDVRSQLLQRQFVQFCCVGSLPDFYYAIKRHLTVLACPMMDDHGVLGDIWLFKPQGEEFDELEIRLVHQVANQCAIALRQSHLYQTAQHQVQELERLNGLKDDFLSTVSHELRSPMANIKMATEMLEILLQDDEMLVSERNRTMQYFKILRDECDRETSLINDLLDLSRLNSQTEPLLLITLPLQPWLLHVAEPFIERAHTQHQSLEFDLPPTPILLTTDFTHLERILTELLHNACKYTAAGECVVVKTRAIEEEDETEESDSLGSRLQISVTNTGIEISPEEYNRIFEKFYRIPNNDPWKHGGTGLGLALVKRRVAHLNGTINVSSSNGQTTFTVVLRQP